MDNILIINPNNYFIYKFIEKNIIDKKHNIFILFYTQHGKTLEELWNIFINKYGRKSNYIDNITLLSGNCLNKNIFLDDKIYEKYYKFFDYIFYVEQNWKISCNNDYVNVCNTCINNLINFSKNTCFIYFKYINKYFSNNSEIEYLNNTIEKIKVLDNYKIFTSSSILYSNCGYIIKNNLFSYYLINSINMGATNCILSKFNINLISIDSINEYIYNEITNKKNMNVTIFFKNNIDYNFLELLKKCTKYNIKSIPNDEWHVEYVKFFEKKCNLNNLNVLEESRNFNKFDKEIILSSDYDINNTIIYLKFNNIIPFPDLFKNYIYFLISLVTSSIFVLILTIILIYIFLKRRDLLIYILIFTCVPFPFSFNDRFIKRGRQFLIKLFSCFDKSYIIDGEIEKYNFNEKRYIYLNSPHDLSPIISISSFMNDSCYKLLNLDESIIAGNKIIYYIPIFNKLSSLIGVEKCDYGSLSNYIKNKSIHLYIGGINEFMLNINNIHNYVNLSLYNRRGIFKIALETGTDIIPTYTFYDKRDNLNKNSSFLFIRMFINHALNMIPNKTTLLVIGAPIKVDKIENPSEDDIINLKNLYISGLINLYDKYKFTFGWPEKELKIY